jgi:ectoine hydroxylase-related dioxygenase (phytanoyl-CoA dioxygenase family)
MRVIITLSDDLTFLPFWLDYHKHIFNSPTFTPFSRNFQEYQNSGIVFGLNSREDKEYIKRIILRFFPNWDWDWDLSSSSLLETNETGMSISTDEFLLFSEEGTETDFSQIKTQKYNAFIYEDKSMNNIVDFFSNIHIVPIKDREQDDSTIKQITLILPVSQNPTLYDLRSGIDQFPEYQNLYIEQALNETSNRLKMSDYIYYLDAYLESDVTWGEDRVILKEDTNLLEFTNFNANGHAVFKIKSRNSFLQKMVISKIEEITSQRIDLEKYHLHISDEEHTKIINAMPWKKTESEEIREFAEFMETIVSKILERRVKIFNDDIWVRICRPSSQTETDYNPCHRDIYLDFYRNIANIYVPIVGSNDRSSLSMQTGSHFWNERDMVVTRGGAFFPKTGKKYSVDAVLRSRQPLNMVRPNPENDEFILFSPYLIHGCSSNGNTDMTRMSMEIRFIEDTEQGKKQEAEFREFLAKRVWR